MIALIFFRLFSPYFQEFLETTIEIHWEGFIMVRVEWGKDPYNKPNCQRASLAKTVGLRGGQINATRSIAAGRNRRAFCMRMRQYGLLKCHRPVFAGCFLELNDVYWVLRSTNVFFNVSWYFYDESEFIVASLLPLRGQSFLS